MLFEFLTWTQVWFGGRAFERGRGPCFFAQAFASNLITLLQKKSDPQITQISQIQERICEICVICGLVFFRHTVLIVNTSRF